MNTEKNNKNLDELITGAIGRDGLKFDFNKWKQNHKKAIEIFKSQSTEQKVQSVRIYKIGKIIMKRPITKLAAAAVIVIAAILILSKDSIDITSTVYAQMRENIKKMPWVHIATIGVHEGKEVRLEQWYSDEERIIALKTPDGELGFSDYNKGKRYIYDPDTKEISISFIEQSDYSKNAIPLQDGIDSMLSLLTQSGASINQLSGEFESQRALIYDVQYKINEIDMNGRFYVNPKSLLPKYCEYIATDKQGNQTRAQMRFDFPANGPQNIYDIGAPVSVKAPSEDLQDVFDTYMAYRKNSPSRYIAIVTENQWYDKIRYFDIIYNNERIQCKEKYSTDDLKDQWVKFSEQEDVPFQDLLELAWKAEGNEYHSISLFTGDKLYWAYQSEDQPWKLSEQPSSRLNLYARDDLAGLGWPIYSDMQNTGTIIEDEYSRKNNLICIQLLKQGEKLPEGHPDTVHLPSKHLFYLNPQRDYICERIEMYMIKDAPWQKDKSWLEGVDTSKLVPDSRNLTEVTKYRQTESGLWYPYKIEFRVSDYDSSTKDFEPYSFNNVKTVYLETNPTFPKGIFDPNTLPKETN